MISGKFLTRPKTRKFQFKPFIPKSFHINLPPHGERTEIPVIWFFRGSSPCFRLWGGSAFRQLNEFELISHCSFLLPC